MRKAEDKGSESEEGGNVRGNKKGEEGWFKGEMRRGKEGER